MSARLISRVLLRAPLLPLRALERDTGKALLAHPLGVAALELASAELVATRRRTGAWPAALGRYARRAAFRPTPHGLLAGVGMAELGARTRIATGQPSPSLAVKWARLARLGRALLEAPHVRTQCRLRRAPSLLRSGDTATWLTSGEPTLAVAVVAEVDERLGAVLGASELWTPWDDVRAAAGRVGEPDEGDLDELLLLLVDQGLLHTDLTPPFIGPPPLDWMCERLDRLHLPAPAAERSHEDGGRTPYELLSDARLHLTAGRITEARASLRSLPGGEDEDSDPLTAVLLFDPARPATLSRAAVARAAATAPTLFRLQEALAPPAAERALDPAPGQALDAVTEVFGAGALDLAALALGDYGTPLGGDDDSEVDRPPPPAGLLALLVDRLMAAAASGATEACFTAAEIDAVLPDMPPPPSFELLLSPTSEPRGKPAGTGWLLGVHAPAGASWGRFAHAIGAPMRDALGALATAESDARPGERRLDVAFAPSADLADLATHPPVREGALALSSWIDDAPNASIVTPSQIELCADAAALDPLALRTSDGGPVVPSPLARIRSTTAPSGAYRLMAGWSLFRQHAPWALSWGPLAGLLRLPRISIDGFVVAPASWRIPIGLGRSGLLGRWRRRWQVPRMVQVGHEDELLLVDLAARGAGRELAGHDRVWEVLPDIDTPVDRDGRRIEVIAAVVTQPDGDQAALAAAGAAAIRTAGHVPPARVHPPAPGWCTFKLYGAPDRHDRMLTGAIAPVIAGARAAGAIDRWFFVRYVDGPGRRDHLRVRVHERQPGGLEEVARQLDRALASAWEEGDVVTAEIGRYHPETARFGGPAAMPAIEAVFESDSDLVCDLLTTGALGSDPEPVDLVVQSFDTLASAFGLGEEARRELARSRRAAHHGLVREEDLAAEYRRRQRGLMATLSGRAEDDGANRPFAAHAARVASLEGELPRALRAATLPALLHLTAVRVAGLHRDVEARAYVFWERALEGLMRSRTSPGIRGS